MDAVQDPPRCRLCSDYAVARFKTPNGCVCYPDDREQDLCAQHIIKWGVIGESELMQVYIPELAVALHVVEA
jgi:hypothetical protein